MNKTRSLIFLFFALLFLQVLFLNNILFLGYINPYLYIAFVFAFPIKKNKIPLLIYAFLLGLSIDYFSDTGGIHAFATTLIAYLRLFFIKLYFKKTETEFPFFKLHSEPFGKVFNYIVTLTIIHHLALFSIANFSFYNLSFVLTNTIYSGIFTVILYFIGVRLFTKNK